MNDNKSITTLLSSGTYDATFAAVLPKGLPVSVFRGILENCVRRTPELATCDPASFFAAARRLAELGLRADGRQAYLIPFNNSQKGILECQLIVSYFGLQDLVMDTGRVLRIFADNVHSNDAFSHNLGAVERHTYGLGENRGEYIGSYCIIEWNNGTQTSAIMSAEEVELIRKASPQFFKASGPHQKHPGEMRKKTAIRRAMKNAPRGILHDFSDDDVIEVESTVAESQPAALSGRPKRTVQLHAPSSKLPNDAPAASAAEDDLVYSPPPEEPANVPDNKPNYVSIAKRGPGRTPKQVDKPAAAEEWKPASNVAFDAQLPQLIRSKLTLAGISEAQLLDYVRLRGMEETLTSLDEMLQGQPLALRTLWSEIDKTLNEVQKWEKETV